MLQPSPPRHRLRFFGHGHVYIHVYGAIIRIQGQAPVSEALGAPRRRAALWHPGSGWTGPKLFEPHADHSGIVVAATVVKLGVDMDHIVGEPVLGRASREKDVVESLRIPCEDVGITLDHR